MAIKNKNFLSFFFGSLSLLVLVYAAALFLAPHPAVADGLIPACGESGSCGFCDIVNVFITLGRWLITGGAGLGLLLIVWAGVGMVTSGGNSEKISASKKQIMGVIIGLGMVLLAFQFVTILIGMTVTPSRLVSAQEGINPSEETKSIGSLKSFLGVPWWTICNIKDMQAQQGRDSTDGSTAHCRYWGDNTACDQRGTGSNVCCRGECVTAPCANPAVVAIRPAAAEINVTCIGQVCGICNQQLDLQFRSRLPAGVTVNKGACPGETRFQDQPGGCTTVGGLPDSFINRLAQVKNECGSFIITGGTECGHSSHGYGKPVIDIGFNDTIARCLKDNSRALGVSKICTTYEDRDFRVNCTFNESIRHLHVEFSS